MESILSKAHDIVFERSEEKERQYGPFIECNERIAEIARVLCQKNITTKDIYLIQIAIKLGRESFNHKQDNLLDAAAYIGALDDYYNQGGGEGQKDTFEDILSDYFSRMDKKELEKFLRLRKEQLCDGRQDL